MTGSLSCAMAAFALCAAVPAAAETSHRYACEDGTRLTASFVNGSAGNGRAILRFAHPASRLILPQALSADGGRYADDKPEFWIKGRRATLTRPGKAQTRCSTRR